MNAKRVIWVLLFAAPVYGQEGPSFDCGRAASSAEKLVCEDENLAALDRRLARRFSAALDVTRSLDAGASDAENRLRATQRGWIKGRNECWKSSGPRDCIEDAYLRREGVLVATWLLEDPVNVAFWECDGSASNEVVTYFFETERPSVRFERGDTVDAGSLVPTASGSRYDGSFGRYIWIKGSEAMYRDADPDGATHRCTLRESD